ncbi:MAG: hypothetical protein U9R25_10330 [Chloroflexota bacterium]|nr:hypothetical protein [Chloroflexota bacterium]
MTTTVSNANTESRSLVSSIIAGAIAGLGGGLVFGMMMAMMGMLPMVAMLVKSQSPIVGFIVHMAISAGIGGVYGLVASRLPQTTGTAIVAGAINGVIWWVLGALILMPLMLGMGDMVLKIGSDQWLSLMGHMIFGVVTGLLFIPLSKRF